MTKERKRGLSLILAIMMLFAAFSCSFGTAAYAEEAKAEEAPVVEEAPKAEEAAPAEEKPAEEPEVVVDVAVLGGDKAEEAGEETPAEEVKEEKKEETSSKTVKYRFIGLDGEEVSVVEVKVGEEVKAPDYKPGEIKWVYKGTETEFVNGPAGEEDKEIIAVEKTSEETEAEAEGKEKTLEEKLNPERKVTLSAAWATDSHYYGDTVIVKATLSGYDNAIYTMQWQTSEDGYNWVDVEGEKADTMNLIVTEDNYDNYWRLTVSVTGVKEEQAAEVPSEAAPAE